MWCKHVFWIPMALVGLVIAGCGSGTAKLQGSTVHVAALAQEGSVCGLAPGSGRLLRSISPGIRVSLLTYTAMYSDANDSSASAATTIQNGRDAFALSNPAGAETEFRQALGLLRTSQRRVQSLAVPGMYLQSKADSTRACRLYVKAISEYRDGIANKDSGLLLAGDADMKAASAVVQRAQTESQAGQAATGASVATLADRAVAQWNARATRERTAHLRSSKPIVLAASVTRASVGAPTKRSLRTQPKQAGTVNSLLAGPMNLHLLYEPNIGTMDHWIATTTVPWEYYPYAQAVNGLKAILRYPGGGAGTFAAPIPVHRLNYAVEARIRLIQYDASDPQKADQYPTDSFGLFIRSNNPVDLATRTPGLMGGVVRIAAPQSLGPAQGDYSYAGLSPISSNVVPYNGYARFQPGTEWHTYRIEVKGEQITLLIDGLEAAQRVTNAAFLGSRVGIFSVGSEIEVSDFQVLGI